MVKKLCGGKEMPAKIKLLPHNGVLLQLAISHTEPES